MHCMYQVSRICAEGYKASQRKNSNLACISWFLADVGSYISYAVYSFLQFNTVVNFQLT